MYGLGIRHVGIKAARLIAQRFKNIDKVMQASAQEIAEIATMGMIIADSVVTYFSMPQSKQLIQQLKQVGVNMDYLGVSDEELENSDSFSPVKICVDRQTATDYPPRCDVMA